METQQQWYRKQEDPEVSHQIRNVGKVAKCDQVEASSWYVKRIPKARNRPALEGQDDGNSQNPERYEENGR